jgi:SAM-dependent methyltransferase
MDPFAPHDVVWTREKIGRYWDYLAKDASKENAYFSRRFGSLIIRFAETIAPLAEPVLDFGCGPGFLMALLLERGYSVRGLDFSAASVQKADERCAGYRKYAGSVVAQAYPAPVESGSIGTVILVEAVEHLLPESLAGVLGETHRMLRPGGILVATTPNQEDLRASEVMCPDCGCVFHTVQHVLSWSRQSLTALMTSHGFATVACAETVFRRGDASNLLFKLYYALSRRRKPNLVYVGRKV